MVRRNSFCQKILRLGKVFALEIQIAKEKIYVGTIRNSLVSLLQLLLSFFQVPRLERPHSTLGLLTRFGRHVRRVRLFQFDAVGIPSEGNLKAEGGKATPDGVGLMLSQVPNRANF